MGRHEVGQLLRHAPSTFCEGAKLRAFLRLGALALVVIDALVSGAYAQDISGAADHPLVPRYEGAEIVLYDEPTTGLDPIVSDSIDQLILKVSQRLKITSIAVTHDMRSARRIAQRIVLLHKGKIYISATPDEIFSSKDPIVYNFVNGIAEQKEHIF